jgi:hypothetical protein
MTANDSQKEYLIAQNTALQEELCKCYYIIEMLRINNKESVEVFERAHQLIKEREAKDN